MIGWRIALTAFFVWGLLTGCGGGTGVGVPSGDVTPSPDACLDGTVSPPADVPAAEIVGPAAPAFACAPCTTHEECGGGEDLCLALDPYGGVCGVHCEDHLCPRGYVCDQVPLAGEGVVGVPWQCVPRTGSCCTPELAGTVGPCHRTNSWGTCHGTRLCAPGTGWTSCSAALPGEDLCNGVDDDCDGVTDQGFEDQDQDGLADCVDLDQDNDGVADTQDNCLGLYNPGQEDLDGDGQGDPCDQDTDGDGWPDWQDCAPADPGAHPGAEELEDGIDNNCDGAVDETPGDAGTCGPDCFAMSSGPSGAAGFDLDQEAVSGVSENEKGYLVLGQGSLTYPSIWIANSGEGTVSRLDTLTGDEKGRYVVCADPSRTAVDLLGDVWIACRGDGGVAKITLVEANCVDQNGDGEIQTSQDANGDGTISGAEMLPVGQDECVRFIVYPGGTLQRAAGVDAENHAWIGSWFDQTLYRLEPDSGATVQEIWIPSEPYGLVIDGEGIIWVSGRGGGQLIRVDPATGAAQALTPVQSGIYGAFEPYGISMDGAGRIWIASCCSENRIFRYTPSTGQWNVVPTKPRPRGLVGHLNGRIYVAVDQNNEVGIFDAETLLEIDYIDLGGERFPIGMSVDSEEQVWAVNQVGASATRIDPDTNQTTGEFPVGIGPYTYSDMTGYMLYTFTSPQGYYFQTFCAPPELTVQWTVLQADMALPGGTEIHVRVRAAEDLDGLSSATWQAPFDPFPGETLPMDLLAVPGLNQTCLQAEFRLCPGEVGESPMLKGISAQYQVLP